MPCSVTVCIKGNHVSITELKEKKIEEEKEEKQKQKTQQQQEQQEEEKRDLRHLGNQKNGFIFEFNIFNIYIPSLPLIKT